MKKIILFFLLSNCILFADWRDDWIAGLDAADSENYEAAEQKFNDAIKGMEEAQDVDHPQVYVDRARLRMLLDRYLEALPDLDKALSSDKIQAAEKTRAVVSRMLARARVGGMDEGVLADLKELRECSQDLPIVEHTENKIIIRNAPECDCYKELMTNYFIKSGMCESESDIKILKSRTWIINKKKKLACGCPNLDRETINSRRNDEEFCQSWCDRAAIGGATWCTHAFASNPACQWACGLAIYELQQGCHWCCEDGQFYQKCGSVFEDILGGMVGMGYKYCKPFFN